MGREGEDGSSEFDKFMENTHTPAFKNFSNVSALVNNKFMNISFLLFP